MAEGNDQQQQNGAQSNQQQNGAQGNNQQGGAPAFDADKFRTALMEDFKAFAQSNNQNNQQSQQQNQQQDNGPSNQDVMTAINAAPEKIVNSIREAFAQPQNNNGGQQQQQNQQQGNGDSDKQEPGKKSWAERWFH